MNNFLIEKVLRSNKCVKEIFIGCFPKDIIPTPSVEIAQKSKLAYVINTGNSDTTGQHWVCFLVDRNKGIIYYFDSLGFAPYFYEYIGNFIKRFNIYNVCHNKHRVQGLNSSVCGQYCILFLIHVCEGGTYDSFLRIFSKTEYVINDTLVCQVISKKFPFVKSKLCYD